jgi:hypothetical protein
MENSALAVQAGINNTVTQNQYGSFGDVAAMQIGAKNTVNQKQETTSYNDNASAIQVGFKNTATQTQK